MKNNKNKKNKKHMKNNDNLVLGLATGAIATTVINTACLIMTRKAVKQNTADIALMMDASMLEDLDDEE